MRVVKQLRATGHDVFRFRVWHKSVYIRGWYAELRIGKHQWIFMPSLRAAAKQLPPRTKD